MEDKNYNHVDKTIISTPKPFATSTVDVRKSKRKECEHVIDKNSSNSDESLGIISIQSEDVGPYIDKLQLKDPNRLSYIEKQRSLANKTLEKRESKVFGLPSRFLRPSEVSNTMDSCVDNSNGSTVNESDLLRSGSINNTSTPRDSMVPEEFTPKVDIAGSMAKMSAEIRNSNMSLENAWQKIEEEYQKVRNSIAMRSDMFKPAELAQSQLMADEESWKREKELPEAKADFTVDSLDTSKMSMSTLFRQRSEDISNIIPSNSRESTVSIGMSNMGISNSVRDSLESIPFSISTLEHSISSEKSFTNLPENESLSISRIANLLQSEQTPTKVVDFLLKQCPGKLENVPPTLDTLKESSIHPNYSTLTAKIDEDSGNFHPNTLSDKENFDSMNVPSRTNLGKMSSNITKSLTSLRTTSSLSDLPEGKLPIETTHCELVWGCVKAGRSETKQFALRNRSSNRLRLQCSISSPSFRIMQERAEDSSNSVKFILHARETKSLSVIFNPLLDGAAVDEIVFTPCDPSLRQTRKQSIQLFGYGGTCVLEFKNIMKDTANRHWLNLGNLFNQSVIREKFTISNKGSLPAFVFIDYSSKNFTLSKPQISPNILIVAPNEQKDVFITLKATGEDVKYIQNFTNPVFELGALKMICGPEPTRGRIRRLCKVAKEKKLETNVLSDNLQKFIQGEAIPLDIVKFKESINSMKTLLQGLTQKEIIIILEKDLDCTLVPTLGNETSMFQSLYQETTIRENKTKNLCVLEPPSLILTPPSKLGDSLFLSSESEASLYFEVNAPKGITVTPASGHIKPHANRIIELKLIDTDQISQSSFTVSVNVGGEVLYTNVKIIFL